ncbi:MAG: ferrochelatase [Myxococcales bacterium]|nr:ferrochelatase [Myxococcales bacterium]MCB9708976.1 ferrochelatase [Myxococcales bacterium]
MTAPDAVLLLSFGGPEGPDEVMPFLRHVVKGRNVPDSRLAKVAEGYAEMGGISPINEQNRRLRTALERALRTSGSNLPVYFGNRHWHPFLSDTLAKMTADGIEQAVVFVTSPYSSYSSCRQYLEAMADAQRAQGTRAPELFKLRPFYNHPEFIRAWVDRAREPLAALQHKAGPKGVSLLFSAHSIPLSIARNCDYVMQLGEVARLVAGELGPTRFSLAFQSRSGSPQIPWLEPDINDALAKAQTAGETHVLMIPIGFVSDHMEVVYDLDRGSLPLARRNGLEVERAQTVGDHPAMVQMIEELIREHTHGLTPRAVGRFGARGAPCAPDCCPLA